MKGPIAGPMGFRVKPREGFGAETVLGKGVYGDSVHRIRRKTNWAATHTWRSFFHARLSIVALWLFSVCLECPECPHIH